MNLRYYIPVLVFLLLLPGCKKNNEKAPEGCINLSELETKHDYYLPFAVMNDTTVIRQAVLNGEDVDFSYGDYINFKENGFNELVLMYKDLQQKNDTFLFTTKTIEREYSEWGIRAWTPASFRTVTLSSENVEIVYPRRYAGLISVPFIFYVKEAGVTKAVYCQGSCPVAKASFKVKRGVGSISVPVSEYTNPISFIVGGKKLSASLTAFSGSGSELKGTISTATVIPANSLVKITENLEITSSGSLTVNEGAVLIISEGVDINVSGPIIFSGTAANPILVTSSKYDNYWGGFLTKVSTGTIEAHYTIFCRSGYHDTGDYAWGHAGRQALFYTKGSSLTLDHCYMVDHIGQIFYPQEATLTLNDILVQRVKTGGQINTSVLTLENSVFTDIPDDSNVFADDDNDALYLNATDADIENTVFMFAKDDGLDSGADGGGTVNITDCRFEACFHEGAALSSSGTVVKTHTFTECVFTNCGQGLELGYSSPNHSVTADNCLFQDNGIGIRYGDNYDWSEVYGHMLIKNSFSLDNDKDVWNMVRMTWSPRLDNLTFANTQVSKYCTQYPELPIKP